MMKLLSKQAVGDNLAAERGAWSFAGTTAKSFVAHARRSIPLYDEGHDLVCRLSDFFIADGSTCYELGASTGELLAKLARYNGAKPKARFIGLDQEPTMIAAAREHCKDLSNVELLQADVNSFEFARSDLIVSYYCFQFIPPRCRQELCNRIYNALNWGGALVMFEKVRAPDARFQDIATALYHDFKTEQGYSSEEIIAKSQSLRGILEPFSSQANIAMLQRAGFVDIWPVAKYVCFEGFVAVR